MNKNGFGIVEFAAWLIVIGFTTKILMVVIVGGSILSSRNNKISLDRYVTIHKILGNG